MPLLETITAIGTLYGIGSNIYDRFSSKHLRKIQDEVLDQHRQYNTDLQRRARGKFTESELAVIRTAAEPQINAVSANVAARLGPSSPAGIALINQAQQAPILAAQQAATEAYAPSVTALSTAVKDRLGQLSGDKSFVGDLKAILEAYKTLEKLVGAPKKPASTPDASKDSDDQAPKQALNMLIGQGYQNSLV